MALSVTSGVSYDPWPALPYEDFASTEYLLHRGLQVPGKLKLQLAFEPQWCHVPLWLAGSGLTTGPIPYAGGTYSIAVDFNVHRVSCTTSWGRREDFALGTMSVAEFVSRLFDAIRRAGVETSVNMKPQEVPNPVPFNQDTELRRYDPTLANGWWRILVSCQRVMQIYHARFKAKTQPIGLMWGTFDIRDVRYNGKPTSPGAMIDYIRRNAMNEELIEVGWWAGSEAYPRAAFYSFTYPQPEGIEDAKISPAAARWEPTMGEFLLDYDDLRKSSDPDGELLRFFESTYQAGAELAGWDRSLVGSGKPE